MICPICKQEFTRRGPQKYCRTRCKHRAYRQKFLERYGITLAAKIWKEKQSKRSIEQSLGHVKMTGGVCKSFFTHGKKWYWVAHIKINGVKKQRAFQIQKLGDIDAKLAATFQRMCWLIEMGAWKPSKDNPFAIMSYKDMLRGNKDYENSEVVDENSPFIKEQIYE